MRAATVAALVAGLALAGCLKKSEKYCGLHAADDPTHCPPADAPPMVACDTSAECSGATPACDTLNNVCVPCFGTDDVLCSVQQLVCGASNTCEPCTAHAQCASKLCTVEGTCAPESQVAYVADTGSPGECTRLAPCLILDDARKLEGRPYIKVTGSISDPSLIVFDKGSTEIYADTNARLTRSGTGPILEVKNATTSLEIYGLRISNAVGTSSHGITMSSGPTLALVGVVIDECGGMGVSAPNGGTLTMSRSVISGNNGGGVSLLDGVFTLTNNLFVLNGDGSASTVGGLRLGAISSNYKFEFNTVADNFNLSGNVTTRGLNCTSVLTVRNNIFVNNQIGPSCTSAYGLFEANAPAGTMNKTGVPAFLSTSAVAPADPTYYRIGATSAALDSADPAATEAIDIDGETRPANGLRDIGADERH